MAATTGIAGALATPLAATTASTVPAPATAAPAKTMEKLLSEIDDAKKAIEDGVKPLEKLDTGRKKAAANRDEAVKGQTKIRELNERVVNLHKQMDTMTKETDPNFPVKSFDKAKKNALKTLSNLTHKLEQADKHLEKATNTSALNVAPLTGTQPTETLATAAATTTSTEGENTKGVGSLLSKLPFTKKRAKSKEPPAAATTTPQTAATPAQAADGTTTKTTKDKVASDEEEYDDDDVEEEEEEGTDDDDVVSDKKKGKKEQVLDLCILKSSYS